ncbi:MAG: M20/M25/M40 family metallo-hydrolase [Planctomycetota bacterium]
MFEPYLRSIEDEAIATLEKLVATGSFTHDRDGVVRLGHMVEELFRPLGFRTRRVRSTTEDCGDHLILTRKATRETDPTLLMVGHLDTVYPKLFPWRVEQNWIHGPGACDIKGGIVCMWMILSALQEHAPNLYERVTWKLLFNATEEGGCADFPELARAEVTQNTLACLIYEPGAPEEDAATAIAVQRKGSGRFRIEAFGREAHSGHAHPEGANAIRELARAVERIESLTDYEREITFNVGVIEGGTTVNTVPAHARIQVDTRAWNTEDFAWAREQVLAQAQQASVQGCRVEVTERPGYPPWPANPKSNDLAHLIVECGQELGQTIHPRKRGGGSDGCHLWDLLPTVDGLGPIGRDPHCPGREAVDRTSFVPRALLSLALLEKLVP